MNKFLTILMLTIAAGFGYVARDKVDSPAVAIEPQPPQTTQDELRINAHPEEELKVEWVSEAEAKASGKPVLYLATLTKNCAPCAKLKGFLNTPMAAEAMNRFSCVLIQDPPSNHKWVQHWERHAARSGADLKFPFIAIEGKGVQPYLQVGAPPSVPDLLHFLQSMEDRFSGKAAQAVIPDATKTSINFPPKPTLAPASHDTAAPFLAKGRSSGKQERSCVSVIQRGNKCYRRSCGTILGGCKSCR